MVTKRRLASPVIALVALVAFSGVASAAPVSTMHTVVLPAAIEGTLDLPALNGQFTRMAIRVDGTANWGAGSGWSTSYVAGVMTTSADWTTGKPDGDLLLEGTQVGAVIYRVDGGAWKEVMPGTMVSAGRHVQVAYNDRPGSYGDNAGELTITVVRTKA